MGWAVEHAAISDIGLQRASNEDAFIDEPPLFAVADGMGGAQAGEVASRVAVETLRERVAAGDSLAAAAAEANRRIFKLASEDRQRAGMGTTLSALHLLPGQDDTVPAEVVHVGDSRIYLVREQAMSQVTQDHSLVGEWLREGAMTAEEAMASRYRSILSRALGTEPDVELDSETIDLRIGDVLLLCSDGLSSLVPEDKMRAALAEQPPREAARLLVDEAISRGGHDNVTVVVLRLSPEGEERSSVRLQQAAPAAPSKKGRRRRLPWLAVAAVLLAGVVLGSAYALSTSYFLGNDRGYVSVYRGLPVSVAGLSLDRLYLSTELPYASLPANEQADVNKHTLRRRDDALREVERLLSLSAPSPQLESAP